MKNPYTKDEKKIMDLLVEAHDRFNKMKRTHPDEMREWVVGIHSLQNVLGWRILRRDYPDEFNSL